MVTLGSLECLLYSKSGGNTAVVGSCGISDVRRRRSVSTTLSCSAKGKLEAVEEKCAQCYSEKDVLQHQSLLCINVLSCCEIPFEIVHYYGLSLTMG